MKLLELHFCEIKYDRKSGARGLVFQGCVVRGIGYIRMYMCSVCGGVEYAYNYINERLGHERDADVEV